MSARSDAVCREAQTPAGSLHRARLLITTIARGSRRGCALTDLVARTGLPRATIHRVLDMLVGMGWVERDPLTQRFNLGRDLAALGYSAISRLPIERVAATELGALAETLGQVVFLNMRSGLDSVCIGRYDPRSEIQVGRGDVGLRTAFGITQSCIAIMSRLPEDEVREIVLINLSRYHRVERYDELKHREAIEHALREGWSCFDGMVLDRSTSGMGVPICDPAGYPVAGIGTTFISAWLDVAARAECRARMEAAAARIAARLFDLPVSG
ncbi:IclR family transcriptional regulator [Methyloversatilis thermotolerans]|uniref:IclR family transcriptional regulator n=1 Tax=Methyloversatilis thermotolerans TaxID=1346290 RepID=UPI00036FB972|nr:helix-turn-helix domain-containing protein [Methyloversatilis thermotolerans]